MCTYFLKGGGTCFGDPISASDQWMNWVSLWYCGVAALLEAAVCYLSSKPRNCQPFATEPKSKLYISNGVAVKKAPEMGT